ncbi:ankyrin repeat and LEM domain-containing protein 1 [Anopheles marshallii]|uniref:ankyrin repeat and LEM domain-containing protein 1 n=1 Tax=Anopheles marshallii TaxID=1521116 RepID=UPI00237AF6C0|nr:ankyrin repeat and LEM domain-containing protein 1 [Anopheles marshallii]
MSRADIYLALCMLDAIEDTNLAGLQLLLDKHRADPNTIVLAKDVAPMHLVIGAENESFAAKATSLMLGHGGNPNLPTVEQLLTPLHVAANLGRVTILQMLLKAGGNVELKDEEGRTPIQHAIDEDHYEALEVIQNHVFEKKIERKRQQLLLEQQRQLKQNVLSLPATQLYPATSLQVLEERAFTPNKIHYNFDATSPYYVNITHRRKDRFKPLFSEDMNSNLENILPTEAIIVSPTEMERIEKQHDCTAEVPNSTNLFELTKGNLKNFTRDSEPTGRRTSFIESWREKIAEMKERTRVSRRLDDIARMLNSFSENPDGQSLIDETFVTATEGEHKKEMIDETAIAEKQEHTSEVIEVEESSEGCETGDQGKVQQVRSVPEFDDHKNTLNEACDTVIIQISEEYIHTDDEAGVMFREKKMTNPASIQMIAEDRQLVAATKQPTYPPSIPQRTASLTSVSTVLTLPPLDYDTDALRAELTTFGEAPGPITKSTKKLYLRKLVKFRRHPERLVNADSKSKIQLNYSVELMATMRKEDVFKRIIEQQFLEQEMASEFQSSTAKAIRNFREGHLKKSFIYLLLDPRVSNNLPAQQKLLEPLEQWRRFLSSVFYVGKGKSSRPYCHLYDALKFYHQKECRSENHCDQNGDGDLMVATETVVFQCSEEECLAVVNKLSRSGEAGKSLNRKQMAAADSKKLNRIIDIWCAGKGVVCLHIFHNIMPAEAYTREAAIIDAFGLQNLTNLKRGDYYSTCLSWPMKKRKQLGILLLYKAMLIHLAEGETQLLPSDL